MNNIFIFTGGAGDCILYSNFVREFKIKYPDSKLTVVVNGNTNKNPYENNPYIDRIILFNPKENLDTNLNLMSIYEEFFDIVFIGSTWKNSYNILDKIKFNDLYSFIPQNMIDIRKKYEKCKYIFPFNWDAHFMQIFPTPEKIRIVKKILIDNTKKDKKNILFSVGAAGGNRDLPKDILENLINKLNEKYTIFIMGKKTHYNYDYIDFVKSLKNCVILIDTDENEILGWTGCGALINEVDYFITPMSGVITLADCYRTPTIAYSVPNNNFQSNLMNYNFNCPYIILRINNYNQITYDLIDSIIEKFNKQPKIYHTISFCKENMLNNLTDEKTENLKLVTVESVLNKQNKTADKRGIK